MNGPQGAPSTRGLSLHAEASSRTKSMNPSMSPATGEPARTEEIQVPRSPQPLSLRIGEQNAESHNTYSSNTAYVESSERGTDTSGESRRPEHQSASTFTGSLPSLPSSSINDTNRSLALGDSRPFDENSQIPTSNHNTNSQGTSRASLVNGNGAIDDLHAAGRPGIGRNGSLSPLRSPRQPNSRSGTGKQFAPGHKRTATGDIKSLPSSLAAPHISDVNVAARRRSKSTGSPAYGSRIAQVMITFRRFLAFLNLTRI